MYPIYVTEGIVLRKLGVGEANAVVSVLTESLGLVRAIARSSRAERSKLRYGLEPQTTARFSFVRGRHEWRLVGAEDARCHLREASIVNQAAGARIAILLQRLIPGQEQLPNLFNTVRSGLIALGSSHAEVAPAIECVLVLRVLAHLGYVPRAAALSSFIENDLFTPTLMTEALKARPLLIRTINESLHASGL